MLDYPTIVATLQENHHQKVKHYYLLFTVGDYCGKANPTVNNPQNHSFDGWDSHHPQIVAVYCKDGLVSKAVSCPPR